MSGEDVIQQLEALGIGFGRPAEHRADPLLAYARAMAAPYYRPDGRCAYCRKSALGDGPHGLHCPTGQAQAALARATQP